MRNFYFAYLRCGAEIHPLQNLMQCIEKNNSEFRISIGGFYILPFANAVSFYKIPSSANFSSNNIYISRLVTSLTKELYFIVIINFEYLKKQFNKEIESVKRRDPAARSTLEIVLTYSGLHAIFAYRVAHKLYEKKLYLAARIISQTARFLTGIEIHPGAKIGKGFFIDHGSGVVIGETTEIGDNCLVYQGVTLGGTGKDKGKRHPTLGNNVMVGAGARVLGPFKVGDNVKIAANAVVLETIPPNCTAVGVPARIVRRNGERVQNCDLDQVHIPDPVSLELCKQLARIESLEKKVNKLEISELGKKYNTNQKGNTEDENI